MQWLLTIRNLPAPEERRLTPRQEAENFWEQAYRLQAALDSFRAENIWLYVSGLREGKAVHLGTQELAELGALGRLPVYGSQPRAGHYSTGEGRQALLADGYGRYCAFSSSAGREVHLCGFNVPGSDLVERLVEMASRGTTKIFLKVTLPKYGIYRLILPAGAGAEEVSLALREQID